MADESLVDRWIAKAKNHPVVAVLCFMAIAIGGVASFSESVSKLFRTESLAMTLEHSVSQGARLERYAMTGAMASWWEAVVSNTGDRAVSLMRFEVHAYRDSVEIEYDGLQSNLIGRVVDTKGERVAFPIALDPGHSTRLYIELKVLLDPKAFDLLSKAYPNGDVPSLQAAGNLLAQSTGIDLFGQKAVPLGAEGDVFGYTVDSSGREPRLSVTFHTSRGSAVSAVSGWYSGGKLLKKGERPDSERLLPR
jgi:hypothetical protein